MASGATAPAGTAAVLVDPAVCATDKPVVAAGAVLSAMTAGGVGTAAPATASAVGVASAVVVGVVPAVCVGLVVGVAAVVVGRVPGLSAVVVGPTSSAVGVCIATGW